LIARYTVTDRELWSRPKA